jgi:transposase
LDVHRDEVTGCVLVFAGGEVSGAKRRFSTTSAGLAELVSWLGEARVERVAMESTGVYWKPVYYVLEGLFDEVWVCNAQHVKNVPGRKSDLSDAEWLADVAAHGMVRPSLVPEPALRAVRDLTRYRKTQIDARGREIQRLEKVLQDAGIKLSSVTSKVLSVSTRAMVEGLIAGRSDPAALADLARTRMRSKIPALTEALAGRFDDHHRALARRILDHIDFLDAAIADLDADIAERLRPFEAQLRLLETMVGWQQRTAQVFLAETGADMGCFPTAAHLASWARICPASHESAGKRRHVGHHGGKTWLTRALIEAARAAARSHNTYYAAQYRRITARRGPNKAAQAVAHTMIVTAWNMLTTATPYQDPGGDYYTRRRNPQTETQRHIAQLEALGYHVTITPHAA